MPSHTPCFISIIATFVAASPSFAAGPATTAGTDAVALYRQANEAIVVDSPGSTNMTYRDYPPYEADWMRVANDAWEQDGRARQLAHEARQVETGNFPEGTSPDGIKAMNELRNVANNLADAAEYQHQIGDDPGAIETIRDLLHLAHVLRHNAPPGDVFHPLVAAGIDALASYHLDVIASCIKLAAAPTDASAVQPNLVHALIEQLLAVVPPDQQMAQFDPKAAETLERDLKIKNARPIAEQAALLRETFARCDAGRITAAISLATHLFKNHHHRWPAALAELVPAYLPSIPTDYWGDGHQPFGYVLISAGLPDGSDRPLVFDRCRSKDGLFYRVDQPEYGFYNGDGSTLPFRDQKQGGQFYDIASWVPDRKNATAPSTRPFVPIGN